MPTQPRHPRREQPTSTMTPISLERLQGLPLAAAMLAVAMPLVAIPAAVILAVLLQQVWTPVRAAVDRPLGPAQAALERLGAQLPEGSPDQSPHRTTQRLQSHPETAFAESSRSLSSSRRGR